MFAVTEIEEHADLCSSWLVESIDWDPIQASGTATVTSVEADTGLVSASTDVMVAGGNMLLSASDRSTLPTLHDLIVQLHNKLAPETTRINVRRKTLWQDYVKERKRKLKPEHALKVVFLGEPAIDDGGPRREFFSGKLFAMCFCIFYEEETLLIVAKYIDNNNYFKILLFYLKVV